MSPRAKIAIVALVLVVGGSASVIGPKVPVGETKDPAGGYSWGMFEGQAARSLR
ncbi:hypothetical protein SAMN05443287_11025 [Micromonospora phaseoli]|uniref:Uncharacterized protein n=1 Tax=Micromonospora phaseoli TaxID=1144548 RepID=A0A1H7CPG5_9ACTN|nr:hypothetical protein [Micromonospora phaseoli]PZV91666.1 hypothetical protein CLV64_111185 [Micromonospora phaseoli]GIJ79298.1 hypothetical protein Xph01_37300 [Micromonospora phaseoli]SEJ91114.1 hypothetical protein SAMN05443287_11025 [Micromonospora phaseoli]